MKFLLYLVPSEYPDLDKARVFHQIYHILKKSELVNFLEYFNYQITFYDAGKQESYILSIESNTINEWEIKEIAP